MTAAWTAPKTWNTNDLVTATDLNTHLRDNLDWLKAPPTANYVANQASDYTTTSTSFVNVDGTNLSLTITTTGGNVLIGFSGAVSNTAAGSVTYLDVEIDGVRFAGDDGVVGVAQNIANYSVNAGFVVLKTGLSAGSHTFKLQWKTFNNTSKLYAGAGTAGNDNHPQFWVREV